MSAPDPREQQLKGLRRLIAAKEAGEDLLKFMQLMMPDPEDPEDALRTAYNMTPQGRLLCQIIEKVERGEERRVAVSIGPQFGKSDHISRKGPAWIAGRNPRRHMILGSYNQDFANDFGHDVRIIFEKPEFKQVFPQFGLVKGGGAKDHLITDEGGKLAFVGVGGSGSGKPADLVIVDDPFRNDEDANSPVYREKVWKWFNGVVMARTRTNTAIIVVHTRWHQDDLIGRLCDPDHPERDGLYKGIAKRWTYINIPAVVDKPDLAKALGLTLEKPSVSKINAPPEHKEAWDDVIEQFGDRPLSALYPKEKPLWLMAEAKQSDPRVFGALYMGKPAPEEGEYFKTDYIVEYDRKDLPQNLRKYGASDHATSTKQRRDFTVLGCVGIDENDDIWVMPDLVWRRMQTDKTVEELLQQFDIHRPMMWWMEDEMISKSFGPFLKKRMLEKKRYTTLDPITPSKDIEIRARSIQGRMSMQKVHFPRFAPWWQQARTQILTFPYATHDDFIAWLALIGLGMNKNIKPKKTEQKDDTLRGGSPGWVLQKAKERASSEKRHDAVAGW